MHLSLWQGQPYCCCLWPLLFPRRPVHVTTTLRMMGNRALRLAHFRGSRVRLILDVLRAAYTKDDGFASATSSTEFSESQC